jgi:hypothetical protein
VKDATPRKVRREEARAGVDLLAAGHVCLLFTGAFLLANGVPDRKNAGSFLQLRYDM